MFSETLKDPVFWQKSVHWHILWIFLNVSSETYFQNSQEVFASLKLLLPLNFFLLVIEKRRNLAMSSQITLRPRSHYHLSKKYCNLRVSRVSWFFNCFHPNPERWLVEPQTSVSQATNQGPPSLIHGPDIRIKPIDA